MKGGLKMTKKKFKVVHNNDKVTWENTDKEQISLALGSAEQRERQEDLQMYDPFKPESKFHKELELSNENFVENIMEDTFERLDPTATSRRKFHKAAREEGIELPKHRQIIDDSKSSSKSDGSKSSDDNKSNSKREDRVRNLPDVLKDIATGKTKKQKEKEDDDKSILESKFGSKYM